MKVVYHPAVQEDVSKILRHYDNISPKLGDAFWDEFMRYVQNAVQSPERYRFAVSTLRRVNLGRFPYHFCFVQFLEAFGLSSCGSTADISDTVLKEDKYGLSNPPVCPIASTAVSAVMPLIQRKSKRRSRGKHGEHGEHGVRAEFRGRGGLRLRGLRPPQLPVPGLGQRAPVRNHRVWIFSSDCGPRTNLRDRGGRRLQRRG
jgi:hypothetical protein